MLNPLNHPICFAYPKRVTSLSAWHEHIPFAMLLVDLLRPKVIVELGTESGDSYCAFCQAVKELNLDTRCYAIDTWQGDSHAGFYDAKVLDDLRAYHDPLYGSFSSLIKSAFDDALSHFQNGSINLLHIDGYHTYEAVRHDFESWLGKLSEDGVVIFHDTNVRERDFGVCIFWDEIKQKYPHFEFLHGHGLGVLAVGKARSKEFQALLESTAEEAMRIRDFFFQLGHRISLRVEAEKKQIALQDTESARSGLESQLSRIQAQMAAREMKSQELLEQTKLQEERKRPNSWQLFWYQDEGFSEEHSLEREVSRGEGIYSYDVSLPINAKGPFRLDPANRPCYAEIHAIAINDTAAATEKGASLSQSRSFTANRGFQDDFSGIIPVSGITRLSGDHPYRMICLDSDPQLLIQAIPERQSDSEWGFHLVMKVSENLGVVLSEEVAKLERELAISSAQLLATTESLKDSEEATRALQSQLTQLKTEQERFLKQQRAKEEEIRLRATQAAEQAVNKLQSEFADEHERLAGLVEQKQSELESLSKEAADIEEQRQALVCELKENERTIESLRAEIASKEDCADALRLEMASQTADHQRLVQLAEKNEESIQTLLTELEQSAAAVRAKDHQLEEKQAEVDEKNRELQKITGSLGWKMLSRYGRIKHRLLLPAYHRAINALEVLAGREYHPEVEPINQLHPSDTRQGWQATGNDPQFNVTGPWPEGCAEVSIDIETQGPVTGHARLYVDRGAGYSETDSYDLGKAGSEQRALAQLGPEVIGLRLDPFESCGSFRLRKFSLKRVSHRRTESRNGQPKSSPNSSQLGEFAKFSLARAQNFRKQNGRSPRLGELPAAVRRTVRAWNGSQESEEIPAIPSNVSPRMAAIEQPLDPYDAWLEVNEWNPRKEAVLKERLAQISNPPLLSVVMPAYNPPPEFLDKAIASVVEQIYQRWELVVADDASTDPAVKQALMKWAEREPRIRVIMREENGNISQATNTAAELARGDYLVLMDQDDELTPDALGEVALHLSGHPETDLLYSDDDKINAGGDRFAPQFKPDWSPELLLSYMYFSHLFTLRRSLFFEVGGMREGYEGSQDYDLALRATESSANVGHIPKVLYHWRVLPGSTALSGSAKPESFSAGMRAVQDALDRRGLRAKAHHPDWARKAGCGIFSHDWPDDGPSVAVIIPTRNNLAILRACLESLEKTTYKNYEVAIIDNQSDDPETLKYLQEIRHKVLTIESPGGKFSFAAINNRAVEEVRADYLLFLNNDTEVVAPNWLSQMAGYLSLPGVGAVGARLLFPDGRLQHAGIIHGYYNGMAGPAFKLLPGWNHGYLSYTKVARNYCAVTAACLLTRRELFLSLGGFDERNFAVAYNDVDYCYRLQAAGHRVVYCPEAELIHHEGYSRGLQDDPAEPAIFRKKYGGKTDPFYNPNLSLANERFEIDASSVAPEQLKPIRALMCAFNLNWEGAPQSQFELTARLKQQGVIDPIVYCPQDGPLRKAYEERGIAVEVFEHPLASVYDLSQYDKAIERFARSIEQWKAEMVYANTRQTFYAVEGAKRLGIASIWNPRESEDWNTYFDYLGPDIAARALRCFAYPYKVIFVSDATREGCLPLNTHHNFMTIPNGLDRERFAAALARSPRAASRAGLGVSQDDVVLLTVGTICERKGQIDLIEAIARMSEQAVSRIKCFVVGDRQGSYSERLKSAVMELPATKRSRLEIVPETSEAAQYYAAADLFALTSRIESFPRVILEAMVAGLPIITTPVFGVREQVQENVNAVFYQPTDAAELADKIERLVIDSSFRRRLAASSRHVLDTLIDFDAMAARYAKVFREAWLSGRSR